MVRKGWTFSDVHSSLGRIEKFSVAAAGRQQETEHLREHLKALVHHYMWLPLRGRGCRFPTPSGFSVNVLTVGCRLYCVAVLIRSKQLVQCESKRILKIGQDRRGCAAAVPENASPDWIS